MSNLLESIKNLTIQINADKFLIIIPLITIIIRISIYLFIPHTYEDAFITFRYAENLADGFGLVYNIGERVYGTTAPLFAIILAGFKYIGISCFVSSLSVNLLAEGLTSLIVYKVLKDYSDGLIAATISLLYVFSPSNISWSIQGMETASFSAVIILSFFCLYKKKYFLSLLFGFLSAIIRIDGISVSFIILFFLFIEKKLSVFKILLFPLLMFTGWLAFLYFYFGNFLPNSMIAKLILYSGHQTSIFPNFNLLISKFFASGYYTSSITTILFLVGIFILIKEKIKLFPMVIWFIIYYLALILSKTNIHGWYLIPPLFVYITISGISLIFIFNSLQRIFNWNRFRLLVLFLICVLFFSSLTLYLKINQINEEYKYERNVRMKIGKFLKNNTPQHSSVYLEPIGVIGYYSERYIYDDAALISPVFLEFNKLPYNSKSVFKKIQFVKPDYLVLRDIYLAEFYSKTNLLNEYKAIKNFQSETPKFDALTIFKRKE